MMHALHWRLPDTDLHGEARGNRPSAIFIHGFGGSMLDWDPVWQRLDPTLDAIRYDLRGFGRSVARDSREFSHSEDLLALIDMQGLAQVDLIGMSMGGGVAANFALNHPGRVRRLVLISPLLLGWDWSQQWRDLWRTVTTVARAGDMAEARRLWMGHPMFETTRAKPQAAAMLRNSIEHYSGAQWIEDRQRAALPDVDRLPLLTCPTLLLSGGQDMPDFRLIADLVAGCARQVRRVYQPSSGHMLTFEVPDVCAEAIETFLRD